MNCSRCARCGQAGVVELVLEPGSLCAPCAALVIAAATLALAQLPQAVVNIQVPTCVHCGRPVLEPGACHALHQYRTAMRRSVKPSVTSLVRRLR